MFKPASLFIGLRYTRAKRRKHFISVISLISMLCFTLGVWALISVLSVKNGFDEAIYDRFFSMARQMTVSTFNNLVPNWQQLESELNNLPADYPEVTATAPYVSGQGMFSHNAQAHAALVFGIEPEKEMQVSEVGDFMIRGDLTELKPGSYKVVIGQDLALKLGSRVGDKIMLITPVANMSPVGILPRSKAFEVVGIFNVGKGFGYDNSYAFIHLQDAQKLYRINDGVSGIRVKLADFYQAPQLSGMLRAELPFDYIVQDWTEQYGAFFEAVKLEKTMLFFVLLLIIIVAAFSLISTLYMVVIDKKADIAILRTYGATPKMVMAIFMVQGTVIGIIGTLLGAVVGVITALTVTDLFNFVQRFTDVNPLASGIYWVDYLPSKLLFSDVIVICLAALFISVLATLLPAWRASKVQPADALRYE